MSKGEYAKTNKQGNEPGDWHIALDGNFRLFRYKTASKIQFPSRFVHFILPDETVRSAVASAEDDHVVPAECAPRISCIQEIVWCAWMNEG